MVNSTLGGSIRDYRLQKGISQLDIAFALGWKEPSRLSRIEQGKTDKPPRMLLDKIVKAIGLDEKEKNSLLLIGNYLPTEDEVLQVKLETKEIIESWQFPAVVLDFSWRLIYQNDHFTEITQLPKDLADNIHKADFRVLNLLFDNFKNQESALPSEKEHEQQFREFLKNVILNFKYEQKNRTKDKWYIEHIKHLMSNTFFRELWVEVSLMEKQTGILGKYTVKSFRNPYSADKILNFYMFIVPFLKDPRFEIELMVPKDIETYDYYQ